VFGLFKLPDDFFISLGLILKVFNCNFQFSIFIIYIYQCAYILNNYLIVVTMTEDVSITFDEQNKIRVLDADKFRETVN
jgi:hypothetical protein